VELDCSALVSVQRSSSRFAPVELVDPEVAASPPLVPASPVEVCAIAPVARTNVKADAVRSLVIMRFLLGANGADRLQLIARLNPPDPKLVPLLRSVAAEAKLTVILPWAEPEGGT